MPKGVEHFDAKRWESGIPIVSNSVMPKGVEHLTPLDDSEVQANVSNSVMPKGVEHYPRAGTLWAVAACRIQ